MAACEENVTCADVDNAMPAIDADKHNTLTNDPKAPIGDSKVPRSGKEVVDPVTGETMSKRKLRKLEKTRKWEENKYQRRQEEREKKKSRRRRLRESGADLGPSRKTLKRNKMVDSSCKVKVVIDCSFDEYMSEKDVGDIVKQISHSYAANRRAENPVQFFVTSVEKKMKVKLDSQDDTKYWDVHLESKHYEELFLKQDIVYLSSDSHNVLTELTDDKVYVIGGLVDHNHHKGLCHRIAESRGLTHAKLPIDQYIRLHARKVLSVNQVFEILVGYTETSNWETAFLRALPKRKGAQGKGIHASSQESPSSAKMDEGEDASSGVQKSSLDSLAKNVINTDRDSDTKNRTDGTELFYSGELNSTNHGNSDTDAANSTDNGHKDLLVQGRSACMSKDIVDSNSELSNSNNASKNEKYIPCAASIDIQKCGKNVQDAESNSSSNVVLPSTELSDQMCPDTTHQRESSSS